MLRWRGAAGGPVFSGVSFDLEPGHAYAEKLRKSKVSQLPRLIAAHVNPRAFEEARKHFGAAIEQLHREGVSAHATAFPLVLDDAEGKANFEDALDTPVSGLDWDEVSFMVYQTAFAQFTGLWFGPSLVASYAQSAVQRFGDRAGIDLGVVGAPALGLDAGERYPDVSALAAESGGSPQRRHSLQPHAGLRPGWPVAGRRHFALAGAAARPEAARDGPTNHWAASGARYPGSGRLNRDLQSGAQFGVRPGSQTSPPSRIPSPQNGLVQSVRQVLGVS